MTSNLGRPSQGILLMAAQQAALSIKAQSIRLLIALHEEQPEASYQGYSSRAPMTEKYVSACDLCPFLLAYTKHATDVPPFRQVPV